MPQSCLQTFVVLLALGGVVAVVRYDYQHPLSDPALARFSAEFANFKSEYEGYNKASVHKADKLQLQVEAALTKVHEPISVMYHPVPVRTVPMQPVAEPAHPVWTARRADVMHQIADDPQEVAWLAYVMYREARGEGEVGAKLSGLSVINRISAVLADPEKWAKEFGAPTVYAVAHKKYAYTGMPAHMSPKVLRSGEYMLCLRWARELIGGSFTPPPALQDELWYMDPVHSTRIGKCDQYRSTVSLGWWIHHNFRGEIRTPEQALEVVQAMPRECRRGRGHVRLMARAHGHYHHQHHPTVASSKPSWWSKLFSSKPVKTAQK